MYEVRGTKYDLGSSRADARGCEAGTVVELRSDGRVWSASGDGVWRRLCTKYDVRFGKFARRAARGLAEQNILVNKAFSLFFSFHSAKVAGSEGDEFPCIERSVC